MSRIIPAINTIYDNIYQIKVIVKAKKKELETRLKLCCASLILSKVPKKIILCSSSHFL